jgi:hypothetical protein
MRNVKTILFIGLNPSRANVYFNDPTITRCINFGKALGFGSLLFGNLYSRISPDPTLIKNDLDHASHVRHSEYLLTMLEVADTVVFCWGSWDFIDEQKAFIQKLTDIAKPRGKIKCFGHNQDGNPKHPLYLKSDIQLQNYYQ